MQETFNEALRNEKQGIPEHVGHPPFHFDYVDSSVQNALAFRYEGYSFIALTVPLIDAISRVCLRLSKSPRLATLLGVRPSDDEYNELQFVLFQILTAFVVTHEWTHHVLGHVCLEDAESIFSNEILDTGCNGNVEAQIEEIVADGYSVHHVLAHLIDGAGRSVLTLLKLGAELTSIQDQVLFALVVVAVGAYLFVRPAPDLKDIYKLTHPPQAARMNFLMLEASGWCKQNRPELERWMKGRYHNLMNAAAEATCGKSGAQVWGDQTAFLRSEEGAEYISALARGVKAYKQSL
jgi:hypothetical protein